MAPNTESSPSSKPPKEKGKRFARFIISFVIAFMAAVYMQIGTWMADFFAHGTIIIIIFILIIIILGLFGLNPTDLLRSLVIDSGGKIPMWSKGVAFIAVIFFVWWIAGMICISPYNNISFCQNQSDQIQIPFIQSAGFPTLQGVISGVFGVSGEGNIDLWGNELFIAFFVILIFAALLWVVYKYILK